MEHSLAFEGKMTDTLASSTTSNGVVLTVDRVDPSLELLDGLDGPLHPLFGGLPHFLFIIGYYNTIIPSLLIYKNPRRNRQFKFNNS